VEKFDMKFDDDVSKDWLRGLLKDGKISVTFEKKDGTIREMNCTLSEQMIPVEKSPKGSGKVQSKESIAVFDLDLGDWRSFRFESVKTFTFDL
jgi:hypothetical protein